MYGLSGFGDMAPTFNFQKTSGASLYPDFKVGDSWTATITGPANQPVWLQSLRGGSPIILTQLGNTDSTGRFSLSGTVSEGEIGSWDETWYVGGANYSGISLTNASNLGRIQFTVSLAASSSPPSTNTQPLPVSMPPLPALSAIPSWALLAGAGIGALLLFGGRR